MGMTSEQERAGLIKKLKSKIVTHKTAFMLDTEDAMSIMELIEQKDNEIRQLKQEYSELEDQASRWKDESGN